LYDDGERYYAKEYSHFEKQYTEEQLREKSRLVINRLMEHESVKKAKTICLYYSLPDEVYTHDLAEHLMKAGKEVLLPRVTGEEEMEIRNIQVCRI
jgi:5-formyltetrahydrofolate cyclo-ligase